MEKKLKSITLSDQAQKTWEEFKKQRLLQKERILTVLQEVQQQNQNSPAFFYDEEVSAYFGPDIWNERVVNVYGQNAKLAAEQMQTEGKRTPAESSIRKQGELHGYIKEKKTTTTTKKRTTRTTRARNINTIEEAEAYLLEQQKASLARAELIRKGGTTPN